MIRHEDYEEISVFGVMPAAARSQRGSTNDHTESSSKEKVTAVSTVVQEEEAKKGGDGVQPEVGAE